LLQKYGLDPSTTTNFPSLNSRLNTLSSKARGKVTFWNDLEVQYFRKIDPLQVQEIFTNLRAHGSILQGDFYEDEQQSQ
jgi:hypothetical protein